MKYLLIFIFSFLFIYLIYYFYHIIFSNRERRMPTEASYLIRLYKLDINKFSYRKFLRRVGFVTSLDVAIVATVVSYFNKLIWQILFGIIVLLPVMIISFMIIGKLYTKKQEKDNTKELKREEKLMKKQKRFEEIFKKKKGDKNDKHK